VAAVKGRLLRLGLNRLTRRDQDQNGAGQCHEPLQ
jgi:hypothetical protein